MLWALNGRTFLRSIPQIWVNRRSDLYQVKCMRSETIFGGGTLITAVSYRPLLHFRRLLWFAHMHERSIIGSFYINSLNNCAALSCVFTLLYSVCPWAHHKKTNEQKKVGPRGSFYKGNYSSVFFFFYLGGIKPVSCTYKKIQKLLTPSSLLRTTWIFNSPTRKIFYRKITKKIECFAQYTQYNAKHKTLHTNERCAQEKNVFSFVFVH